MRVGATTAVLAVAFGAWLADADVEVVVDRTCNTDSIFDTTKLGCYSCDGYFDIDGGSFRSGCCVLGICKYCSPAPLLLGLPSCRYNCWFFWLLSLSNR